MAHEEEIKELEDKIATTKYNKHTQFGVGQMKAKLARLKEDFIKKSASKAGLGYSVKKTGDATAVFLGYPSVGKSTLLNKITNADSAVGAYDFTTLDVIPGLLKYKHAQIQVLDVPGIVEGAASGRGRGREVLAALRAADLIIFLIDATRPIHLKSLQQEVYEAGIRANEREPNITIKKKPRGGISLAFTVKMTKIDKKTAEAILREMKIMNCDVVIRSDVSDDQFIDTIEGNRVYIPGIVVLNKIDLVSQEKLEEVRKLVKPDCELSAEYGTGFEELKEVIYKKLRLIRIYTKESMKKADMTEPLIMREGATLRTFCERLHKDFAKKFEHARLWGKSAKFDGQVFRNLEKGLADEDIVEIHVR